MQRRFGVRQLALWVITQPIWAMQERVGVVNGQGARKRGRDGEVAIQDEVTEEDDAGDDDLDGTSVFNLAWRP